MGLRLRLLDGRGYLALGPCLADPAFGRAGGFGRPAGGDPAFRLPDQGQGGRPSAGGLRRRQPRDFRLRRSSSGSVAAAGVGDALFGGGDPIGRRLRGQSLRLHEARRRGPLHGLVRRSWGAVLLPPPLQSFGPLHQQAGQLCPGLPDQGRPGRGGPWSCGRPSR